MSRPDASERERLEALLAERATQGLDPSERSELDTLCARFPDIDTESFDLAASALAAALAPTATGTLPDALRAGIEAQARALLAGVAASGVGVSGSATRSAPARRGCNRAGPARPRPRPRAGRRSAPLAWSVAAAAVVLAVLAGTRDPAAPPKPALTPSQRRAELLATGGDVVQQAWTSTGGPAGPSVQGDVVWSPSLQEGYLRFRGLAANDPAREQYQLWIFDATRDGRHPIDGGVFDIPPGEGEVVLPIDARLPAREVTLFAVTVERPGGVVVSTRERMPVLAQLEAAG